MTIGIIDSGIDTTNPEFAGRISSASADVAANRGINPEDEHGTDVALVAAAARDNSGIMGIAYNATILAMRADSPGSCASGSCSFFDSDIATGIERAIAAGAKVINLSLGGSAPSSAVSTAIAHAANAGVVVIVAAGNQGGTSGPGIDPANPEPFAMGLQAAGNGNVIIAGSVDSSGNISSFSNLAGSEANWFLTALGERICCAYANGTIKVTTNAQGQQFVTVFSGTSFSTPQIAGAVALLRQAFPNLTAVQVVNLLLTTARDAGATGIDTTYGRGILDITNAFAPQGTTTVAGTTSLVPLGSPALTASAAMGDAVQSASVNTILLDSYRRAYQIDLGAGLRSAPPAFRLTGALTNQLREVATGTDRLSVAFSVDGRGGVSAMPAVSELRLSRADAETAHVLAARIVARLSPNSSLGFAIAQGADGLMAQLRGQHQPAFLIAGDPVDDVGFSRRNQNAAAFRRDFGGWGVTLSAEEGQALSGAPPRTGDRASQNYGQFRATRIGFGVDRSRGNFDAGLAASWLSEDRTVLGARMLDSFGSTGADSIFLDANAAWRFATGWRLGAAWRQGYTAARAGGFIAPGSRLVSNAWALDLQRMSVFGGDSIALRVSQPLRVQSGGLNLDLPVTYSYETLTATRGIQTLALNPHGREITTELAWRGTLWSGAASASLFYRRDPGHYAGLPADKGVAFSWTKGF